MKKPVFVWPLKRPLQACCVGQPFGVPWSANKKALHTGIDIRAIPREPVLAASNGKIVKIGFCGRDPLGSDWAEYVILLHESKKYCTGYLHINPEVALGAEIKSGDIVGEIADIVRPHLHFGIWCGRFDSKITPRGALPTLTNESVKNYWPEHSDPFFPHRFVDPKLFEYVCVGKEPEYFI